MSKLKFGKVQLSIMKVLWGKKCATAWEITEAMNRLSRRRVAHSSVQTHLRELEKNGAIGHDVDNRTFVFYPLVKQENVVQHAFQDFVEQIFSGSATGLVSYIVENKYVSPEELKKIRDMLDNAEKDNT